MYAILSQTTDAYPGLTIRVALGSIMFAHGCRKMLGLFGGCGFNQIMEHLIKTVKMPFLLALFVVFTEFYGSLFLLLGIATRIWAFSIILLMIITAIFGNHLKSGFFMNWEGLKTGEGFEYHLLVVGCALTLLFTGAGKYSIDLSFYN